MNMMTKSKPDWFDGEWYTEGDTVRNPFSGETYKLTGPELSMYDFIIGATYTVEQDYSLNSDNTQQLIVDLEKGLRWFRKNNPKAYMVLLD